MDINKPLTKVHAFQIKTVDEWMSFTMPPEDDRGFVQGHNAKEHVNVPDDMMRLFKPQPGHYCIVWPHGLVTFRDPESFAKDFTYRSGTVYETPLEALFQKGMMSPEGQLQLKQEREERQQAQKARWERQAEAARKRAANPVEHHDGYVVRHVVPGLLPVPSAFVAVQPRYAHVAMLPIIAATSLKFD